jgi:predicted amidohydrolase
MGDRYPTPRVAAIQAAPVFLDRDASVTKARGLIAEAGRLGAELAVFPETWLPGYPVWFDRAPGSVLWDDPAAKAVYARLVANAVEVPGPAIDALATAAAAAGCAVVMGINERDPRSRTLYNTIVTIDADGRLAGTHRKLAPTYAERLVWGRGGGGDLRAFPTAAGKVGGLVCWEHWMPLARHAMHLTGEEVHAALWPDVDDIHHLASRHYAFEGRCFVVAVGAVLRKRDLPADLELFDGIPGGPDELLLRGGSAIIGPDGMVMAGPAGAEETILLADLPFERIAAESMTFDAVGHYARPDVFRVEIVPTESA